MKLKPLPKSKRGFFRLAIILLEEAAVCAAEAEADEMHRDIWRILRKVVKRSRVTSKSA